MHRDGHGARHSLHEQHAHEAAAVRQRSWTIRCYNTQRKSTEQSARHTRMGGALTTAATCTPPAVIWGTTGGSSWSSGMSFSSRRTWRMKNPVPAPAVCTQNTDTHKNSRLLDLRRARSNCVNTIQQDTQPGREVHTSAHGRTESRSRAAANRNASGVRSPANDSSPPHTRKRHAKQPDTACAVICDAVELRSGPRLTVVELVCVDTVD